VTVKDLAIAFGCSTGYHYNLLNICVAFSQAKDKLYAFTVLLPYAQFFVMLYFSCYSQFWFQYTFLFLIMHGLYLLYVTGIFNLNSTAGMRFNPYFVEPYVFAAVLYLDVQGALSTEQQALAYVLYVAMIFIKYLLFMRSVVSQLTAYLGINFVTVKSKKQ